MIGLYQWLLCLIIDILDNLDRSLCQAGLLTHDLSLLRLYYPSIIFILIHVDRVGHNASTLYDLFELLKNLCDRLSLSSPLISEVIDKVTDGDNEGAKQWLVETLEDVVVHRAQHPRLIQLINWQGYQELDHSVDGGVGSWRVRLRLDIFEGCADIRRNQTLEVEYDKGLLHWQYTCGLKISQTQNVDLNLKFFPLNQGGQIDFLVRSRELVVEFDNGKADEDLTLCWGSWGKLALVPLGCREASIVGDRSIFYWNQSSSDKVRRKRILIVDVAHERCHVLKVLSLNLELQSLIEQWVVVVLDDLGFLLIWRTIPYLDERVALPISISCRDISALIDVCADSFHSDTLGIRHSFPGRDLTEVDGTILGLVMNAQFHRDNASLVMILDLANGEVRVHLEPLDLRALVHKFLDVCLVIGHRFLAAD